MITKAQAAELLELIETCQWEEAKRYVEGLAAPEGLEASLLFSVCERGKATGRIFEAKARQIEADVQEAVLQHARGLSTGDAPASFTVHRLVVHGEYETAKVARRK